MARFRMGDHEFIEPGGSAPIDRMFATNKRPIRGAIPPHWLHGIAFEAVPTGPARQLVDGAFCGHGEPTFGVFDIVMTGVPELELALSEEAGSRRILARPAGGREWVILHDSRWFAPSGGQNAPPTAPSAAAGSDIAPCKNHAGKVSRFRISVGYEYPVECQSENDVSWVTFAMECLDDDSSGPFYDEELA